MIRISTIFIAISMVLIATALGVAVYYLLGLAPMESALVAVAALTFLVLYNAVALRLRDRNDVGDQIADLSRGTADLARQVGEFGRRLAYVESRINGFDHDTRQAVDPLAQEIVELGSLVKQLAVSVATHEGLLATPIEPPPVRAAEVDASAPPAAAVAPQPVATEPAAKTDDAAAARLLAAVHNALEANRIDLYLQPLVTLPQRKVRYYEAVARLRDENGTVVVAGDFLPAAEAAGLMGRIDNQVLFRCVQVLRRLMGRNKDIGLFCNLATTTLTDPATFAQCLEFLDANRVLAPSLVLEFRQSALRQLGPVGSENLATLAQRGFRLSVDHVTDLHFDPRELADRGVRFIKIPATLLLDETRAATANIHPADLSDLLGRFGIDLVAEKIEGERAVVDLLDYDVRYGQGFLFAPPRPLRQDNQPGTQPSNPPGIAGEAAPALDAGATATAKPDPVMNAPAADLTAAKDAAKGASALAALARRAAGPVP